MIRTAWIAALCALAATACGARPARQDRPSIVLISIDSLRPDHLGCYGYPKATSPAIDRIAAEGARFETAVSTTAWTLPAHAAMLTGLYDSAHGLFENALALADAHVTLAELLREAGYQTAGFFGGPYLHPTYALDQGFETYQSCMTQLSDSLPGEEVRLHAKERTDDAHRDVTGPRTVAEITKWAQQSADARPFFVFVHMWDVHYDYIPPEPYARMFDPDYTGTLRVDGYMDNEAIRPDMDPRELQHVIALYDGEIRFTDDNLAAILGTLERKAGGKERLCVMVTADHGEEFFDHGRKGHSKTLFDEVVKVPLVLRWPGHVPAGSLVREQVRLIDILPTLTAVAGARTPEHVQGRNLLPFLEPGTPIPKEPALLELLVHPMNSRAVRTDSLKVVKLKADQRPGKPTATVGFRLDVDPKESVQIGASDPDVARGAQLLSSLVERSIELRVELHGDPRRVVVDPRLEERLKELGY